MSNTTTFKSTGRPNYSARKVLPSNTIAAGSAMPPGSLPFNAVVQLTVDADARTRAREAAMTRDEARTRAELSGIYLPRFRANKYAGEEQEQESGPTVPTFVRGRDADEDGFTEVKKKERKVKREMTTAELNRRVMEAPSDDEDGEINAELYDNARQHEHL